MSTSVRTISNNPKNGSPPTFGVLEEVHDGGHGRHRQLGDAAGGHGLLQGKARAVADGAALLHLDELAQVGQGRLHLGVDLAQRRALDGALEELGGKGRVRRQAAVAAKRRLLLAALIVGGAGGRAGGGAAAAGAGRVDKGVAAEADAAGAGMVDDEGRRRRGGRGERLEQRLDVAEAGLDLVYLALTGGVSA